MQKRWTSAVEAALNAYISTKANNKQTAPTTTHLFGIVFRLCFVALDSGGGKELEKVLR
jgi:hypothetical protein